MFILSVAASINAACRPVFTNCGTCPNITLLHRPPVICYKEVDNLTSQDLAQNQSIRKSHGHTFHSVSRLKQPERRSNRTAWCL
ncbi:hypothetical protein BaRGS_00010327 [Batillaria attramentaria]|uniref:Secreted protein n=1 Tax=Batillaria attramentaria TaxID=370345 RepID=A0ABD0LGK9_9CAEN